MTLQNARYKDSPEEGMYSLTDDIINPQAAWHVLWTRSNFEQRVFEELVAADYEMFLPMISQWSPGARMQPLRVEPMFKGYMFVRHAINKAAFLHISNTKGVVALLGKRWDKLAQVADEEIASIRCLMESRMPIVSHPYIKAGTEVRITKGPMMNLRGIMVRTDQKKGYFVVSVQLLQRSVAVSVDCCDVAPV